MWLKHSQNKHTLYKVTKFWSLELFGCIFHLRPMFIVCKRNKKGIIKRKEWRMSSECKKKKKILLEALNPTPHHKGTSLSLSLIAAVALMWHFEKISSILVPERISLIAAPHLILMIKQIIYLAHLTMFKKTFFKCLVRKGLRIWKAKNNWLEILFDDIENKD